MAERITDAMLEAGAAELLLYDSGDSTRRAVADIYRAMRRAFAADPGRMLTERQEPTHADPEGIKVLTREWLEDVSNNPTPLHHADLKWCVTGGVKGTVTIKGRTYDINYNPRVHGMNPRLLYTAVLRDD